jgi:hypothetical protein
MLVQMTVSLPLGSRCFHCEYDLRSLPQNVCPECGNAFDPQNPFTYIHPALLTRWRTKWLRRALRPPPLFDCLVIAAAAGFVIVRSSSPGWPYILLSSSITKDGLGPGFWVPFLFLLGLIPFVNFIRRGRARRKLRHLGLRYSMAHERRWPLMFGLSVILLAALAYPWPLWIRFAASLSDLQHVVAANQIRREPSRIGLFHVQKFRIYSSGVVLFVIERDHDQREHGIAFAPRHTSAPGYPYWNSRRLGGHWWITATGVP